MKAKERSYQGGQTLWGKSHRGLVLNVHTGPHSPTLQRVQGNCIQKRMALASFLASVLKYQQSFRRKGVHSGSKLQRVMDSIVAEKTWQQKMWLAYHTISACPEVERPHEAGPESKVSNLSPLRRNSSSKAPPLKCSVTVPNIPSSWESNVQTHTMRDMLLSQHDTHFDCSGTQLGCLVILQNPEFPYTIP